MIYAERFDKVLTGLISGFLFPFIVGIIIYLFTSGQLNLNSYIIKIADSDIITHSITLCVFPDLLIFLIFNRLDMLRASRGVLAATIIWAFAVFAIKFLA